jgi:palmitoyltransferase ZDHHC9/14/18
MATQRSLPFSPSTPTVPVSQRPSQLPSSLSSVGLSTKFESITTPRSSRHARTSSAVSTTSRPRTTPGDPSSPTRRTFSGSTPVPLSATHVPGILPPPPFFHPSRPTLPPLSGSDASRPSSVASSNALSPLHDRETSNPPYPLQPLAQDVLYDSDGLSDSYPVSGDRTSRNSMQEAAAQQPVRNQKQSREPLLPLGGLIRSRSGSLATHWSKRSLARNVVEKNATSASATARMRDSFERFRKGLSVESVRKSLSNSGSARQSPVLANPPSARSEPTALETKEQSDEEYKASGVSPVHLRHQSSATFIPYPPAKSEYPPSSVPVKHEKSARYVRNHERISSANRWFLQGRLLVGGDKPWAFIGSLIVLFGISGVWFGTTCVWWWQHKSPAVASIGAYMCLLTISLMLSTVGL